MQLFALNTHQKLIFAARAEKHHNYTCLECGERVRIRKGSYRQPHYYHTEPNLACRQSGKGMAHLLTQYHLKALLPEGEVELEYRFDAIGRIADVVWLPRRLIYEIQYSQITAEEINARNKDYASQGYLVIWILHDQRYNQKKITSAEDLLFHSPHYFTNIDTKGDGIIYDQYALMDKGKRLFSLPRLPVDLSTPYNIQNNLNELPVFIQKRANQWMIYFSGDSIACCLEGLNKYPALSDALEAMMKYDRSLEKTAVLLYVKEMFNRFIKTPYRSLLHLLLERACR